MSFLQRLGFVRQRKEEALLAEQVTNLQAALAKCKGVASRWRRTRGEVTALVGAVMLALGFVLGVYSEALKHGVADLLRPLGFARSVPDGEAGYFAYQNGSYEKALQLLRPLAEKGDARAQSVVGLMYYQGNG